MIGTFVLVLAVLYATGLKITSTTGEIKVGMGSLGAIPVAFVVIGIGLSLGGTTGYAINPARDLGPRLIHHVLPIPNKGDERLGLQLGSRRRSHPRRTAGGLRLLLRPVRLTVSGGEFPYPLTPSRCISARRRVERPWSAAT